MPTNIVTDWVTDWAVSLADSLTKARVDVIQNLLKTSLPSLQELRNGWFMTGLGGTFGLANLLVTFVAVAVAFTMILSPLKDHSLRINRTVTSLIYTSIFGFVFFRLYALAFDLTQAGGQGLINLAFSKETTSLNEAAELLTRTFLPADPWIKVFVAGIGFVLTYLAYIVAYLNVLMIYVLGVFYILVLALRPLGKTFNSLFHVFNAGLATTLVTPLIMTFGLMLPVATERFIPFGSTGVGAGLSMIIGSLMALFGPLLFAMWVFKKSNEVFGAIDASISGRIDIGSMPNVTTEQMSDSVRGSALGAFGSTFATGVATANLGKSDDMMGDITKLAIEAGGTAAAAAGHPWVAAAASAVDTTITREKRAHDAEQHPTASMPRPTGSPVAVIQEVPSGEQPGAAPPTPSPIQEWPGQ
jgi:hypothetical protein